MVPSTSLNSRSLQHTCMQVAGALGSCLRCYLASSRPKDTVQCKGPMNPSYLALLLTLLADVALPPQSQANDFATWHHGPNTIDLSAKFYAYIFNP